MKATKALSFALLLLSSLLYSQNTFKLGYTGAYPTFYDTDTRDFNWTFYTDLNLNTIQGWWIGDNDFGLEIFTKLDNHNIDGLFQPDSRRWAGYGMG